MKIKQFQSQASKYSRELAAYDQKQLELDQLTSENFVSESLPFTVQSHGNKTMKRRKRKRVEDTTDVTLYMSQHNLFSYNGTISSMQYWLKIIQFLSFVLGYFVVTLACVYYRK